MPTRIHYLVTRHFYHLYNKTLENLKPFKNQRFAEYFLNSLMYYNHTNLKISYSRYLLLDLKKKKYFRELRLKLPVKMDILAYCLMPNHFHLLVKQKLNNGISSCIRDTLNSFSRFYNLSLTRRGPIFLPRFKSKPIISEEHLIHVSRYIHLNPYKSYLCRCVDDIWKYNYSSARFYLDGQSSEINMQNILQSGYFLGDRKKYQRFVENLESSESVKNLLEYSEKWES